MSTPKSDPNAKLRNPDFLSIVAILAYGNATFPEGLGASYEYLPQEKGSDKIVLKADVFASAKYTHAQIIQRLQAIDIKGVTTEGRDQGRTTDVVTIAVDKNPDLFKNIVAAYMAWQNKKVLYELGVPFEQRPGIIEQAEQMGMVGVVLDIGKYISDNTSIGQAELIGLRNTVDVATAKSMGGSVDGGGKGRGRVRK